MKIGIIGAGFSGLYAAYLLEKSGATVTVYEKEELIGGHCRTIKGGYSHAELGTTFAFSHKIKELLLSLKVDYSERLIDRSFKDKDFNTVEHLSYREARELGGELHKLQSLLACYEEDLKGSDYGHIPEELIQPLCPFLQSHGLNNLCTALAPLMSSFGFGSIQTTSAYYALKVFDMDAINTFLRGEKLLFIKEGTGELIYQLSRHIKDIRTGLEVVKIDSAEDHVVITTPYSQESYDKVLVSAMMPSHVFTDGFYAHVMDKLTTNPYYTCIYAASDRNLPSTYYRDHMGQAHKLQFCHPTRHNHQTLLVAYAYGTMTSDHIDQISQDIKKSGVHIEHLITAKQWYIFPHLNQSNIEEDFYTEIDAYGKKSNIQLMGSLKAQPSIVNLYTSVKETISQLLKS